MIINLNNLREALAQLEGLPEIEVVKQTAVTDLPSAIRNETSIARMLLKETIRLIEETATLDLLVNSRK